MIMHFSRPLYNLFSLLFIRSSPHNGVVAIDGNSIRSSSGSSPYRGRLAPSPTGYLHLGHAKTFWIAQQRARLAQGKLLLRNEDLDAPRARPEFVQAMLEDLRWFGFQWDEGPDCGGPCAPYSQSERRQYYCEAFEKLRQAGHIYPCRCSRKDVLQALQAPHAGDEEPIYPGTCRSASLDTSTQPMNWRFRVPDGEPISFDDACQGRQTFVAGKDFGDFVVWRNDGLASYQLAVVVDDAAMGITEVVRGADLLVSTARQILLYRALNLRIPEFYHCHLVRDETGKRLAKRHDALSLRKLREQGATPEDLRRRMLAETTQSYR
jgi:glutamyl-queuosine tRNA(Asp) synthetase